MAAVFTQRVQPAALRPVERLGTAADKPHVLAGGQAPPGAPTAAPRHSVGALRPKRVHSGQVPKVIKRGTPIAPSTQSPSSVRPAPAAKKRIIEREVVGATQEAAEIRRRAEDEAHRILEEAREQAHETRQHGFEEGKQQAMAQYTQKVAEALARVRQIEESLEPLYVGLVRDCCEQIIGQELKQNPAAIVGVVRNALIHARQQREILIRVNPADVEVLNKSRNRLLEMLARAQSIEIREDASIARGGCVVITELGTIEANLERQLEALAAALQDELREGTNDGYREQSELDPEDDPGYGGQY